MDIVLHRFRPIARELSEQALRSAAGGPLTPVPAGEWSLTEEDVLGTAPGLQRELRVLGQYSREGLELLFERLGVFERLRSLGFTSPVVDVAMSPPVGHTVRVFGERARRHLLIELRLGRNRSAVPECEVAFVEWLLLQNPRARFQPDRPPLPGQQHPGLGMLGLMAGTLVLACEQAGLDGVAHVLSNFHFAAVGRMHMRFLDPAAQARFDALREALEHGRQVKLSGFGNFDLRRKNQRPGRNPKTGEEIPISARRVVTFRPGQKLRLRVEFDASRR
jgi:integration host factor subunit alpha